MCERRKINMKYYTESVTTGEQQRSEQKKNRNNSNGLVNALKREKKLVKSGFWHWFYTETNYQITFIPHKTHHFSVRFPVTKWAGNETKKPLAIFETYNFWIWWIPINRFFLRRNTEQRWCALELRQLWTVRLNVWTLTENRNSRNKETRAVCASVLKYGRQRARRKKLRLAKMSLWERLNTLTDRCAITTP